MKNKPGKIVQLPDGTELKTAAEIMDPFHKKIDKFIKDSQDHLDMQDKKIAMMYESMVAMGVLLTELAKKKDE